MRKKNRIVELDYTCKECDYVFGISIDKDIKIFCPGCGFRDWILERNL